MDIISIIPVVIVLGVPLACGLWIWRSSRNARLIRALVVMFSGYLIAALLYIGFEQVWLFAESYLIDCAKVYDDELGRCHHSLVGMATLWRDNYLISWIFFAPLSALLIARYLPRVCWARGWSG